MSTTKSTLSAMRFAIAVVCIDHLTALDNGAANSKRPPLGWSSWVSLGPDWPGPDAKHPVFDFCDEASVKASIDAYHEVGLYDAGYRHFHLDDCWADRERNATGFLQPERDHFPNGMKPLVDYAHSKGLTFGLYTCAGSHTCVGHRPGSKDHWDQDAQVWAEWGVDVMKMDWCNTKGMQPEATYSLMSAALNRTGKPIHFNLCEWGVDDPWEWAPKLAQSWRATGDHTGTWDSTKNIIDQRAKIPAQYGGLPYAWNDMDMLETGNYAQAAHANGRQGKMTATEYKTEFSMWAILASSMVVTTPILDCTSGTCVPKITDLQKEILLNTEVIAINQDLHPAGRRVTTMAPPSTVQIFARNISGTGENVDVAVALYNPGDDPADAHFTFDLLQGSWSNSTMAHVRDLWALKDLGTFKGRFPSSGSVTVDAHATMVLRLVEKAAPPTLVV